MTYLAIQTINSETDLEGHAFEANKKINFNLKQLNNQIELLPEKVEDLGGENLSVLKYLSLVNETIHKNSLLIGFDYPKYDANLAFSYDTKSKIYDPINSYFKSLTR
ncbi:MULTISPECIES: hypothetical protein [unclassified Acinetobacter]|uniref:hypothetical protein n=1 Tax=unclassified Acinetobacter TaxID=196816 RepID=UPI0012508598|nr:MULTISPECIES: hypothetical protein [unclassified Acinetobacter]